MTTRVLYEFYRGNPSPADKQMIEGSEIACAMDEAVQAGLPVLDFGGYGPCRECPDADNGTADSRSKRFPEGGKQKMTDIIMLCGEGHRR